MYDCVMCLYPKIRNNIAVLHLFYRIDIYIRYIYILIFHFKSSLHVAILVKKRNDKIVQLVIKNETLLVRR